MDDCRTIILMVRTFLKVYGARLLFLFLQEQIKDSIITGHTLGKNLHRSGGPEDPQGTRLRTVLHRRGLAEAVEPASLGRLLRRRRQRRRRFRGFGVAVQRARACCMRRCCLNAERRAERGSYLRSLYGALATGLFLVMVCRYPVTFGPREHCCSFDVLERMFCGDRGNEMWCLCS